ncbi:MAG: hypothetical protein IPI97_14205 [Nitrosomonas sp.]|nr:hypothetical protein [Nitrosomonas sp.]
MTCTNKLYASTDIDIPLTISSGFVAGDIQDLEVTLTNKDDESIFRVYKKSLNEITVVGSVVTLLVLKTHITTAGKYAIKIRLTDTSSKVRGITPCVDGTLDYLRFY